MDAVELLTDWAAIEALKDDWLKLWKSAGDAYFSQSFEWCATRWRMLAAQGDCELACVVMRNEGQVSLIWPLIVRREALWRIARPLEQATTEYGAVLNEEAGAQARIAQAWRFVRANVRCDLFMFKATPALSPLDQVLREAEPGAALHVAPHRFVRFDDFADWDAYYRSVKNDKRRGLERRIRRLTETGAMSVALASAPAERAAAIAWIFKTKAHWLDDQREIAVWRESPGYEQFLAAVPADDGARGGLSITLLKLDGKIIAGEIARVDRARVEPIVSTFDPAFAKYSPGEILCRECIKAAHARGLAYDFRIGDDPYKGYWANGGGELHTYKIAVTPMGALRNALSDLRQHWRRRANMKQAVVAHAH
jgi:CelD/BcsL family acetyltransferase involved in cellulose biosynthesis